MSWFINVNKHIIANNARTPGPPAPPVRISKGKSGKGTYCFEAEIPAGSRIVYDAANPILKCGARLVIECPTQPEVIR
jgi:hypothetical protein